MKTKFIYQAVAKRLQGTLTFKQLKKLRHFINTSMRNIRQELQLHQSQSSMYL